MYYISSLNQKPRIHTYKYIYANKFQINYTLHSDINHKVNQKINLVINLLTNSCNQLKQKLF